MKLHAEHMLHTHTNSKNQGTIVYRSILSSWGLLLTSNDFIAHLLATSAVSVGP